MTRADRVWLAVILWAFFVGTIAICLIAIGRWSPIHLIWAIPLFIPFPACILLAGGSR